MQPAGQQLNSALFQAKSGAKLIGVTPADLLKLRTELFGSLGVSPDQSAEAASYSMAMVVRFALGLSAESGAVTALLTDSFAGLTAAATLRHLVNASCNAHCFVIGNNTSLSSDFQRQLSILERMGIPLDYLDSKESSLAGFSQAIARSHNVINGTFSLQTPAAHAEQLSKINELLNEARTPVHCLECPSGVNPESGGNLYTPLFASSTLSFGAPLIGLFHGRTQVGRHYVCDISLTREMYSSLGCDFAALFSEQPVVQIFPIEPAEG